ncbi:MAG: flagellar export protein FliJ, partial [Lachnospiraceae bacterium]|nr:flagellar export protein FliJ [Lachnospiraceae bacterium]
MARFRYRMQNILNVKEKLETQAKNEFALAAAKEREEEAKLLALKARRDEHEAILKGLVGADLDITSIKEAEDGLEVIKYHIGQQELNLAAARQELEVARQKLTAAMQDRKTHERLKERQFEVFKQEEAAKESKEIDELVSYRHGLEEQH